MRLNNFMSSRLMIIIFLFLISSCFKRPLPPPIGNNISFPGHLVALDTSSFLLLNTVANGDYSDGSIQRYTVDNAGNYSMQNVISIPTHGTELAVSSDSKLVALSFDSSYQTTQIQFFNFLDPANPVLLSNLTLNSFNNAGGKQTVKRLGFFTRSGDPNYYFYGAILSYPQDNGSNAFVPPRVFVAKIASDLSSSQILFTLSFGVGDPHSLSQQSTAWNNGDSVAQYKFGFSAPTYDATHDLFIAFPTGTLGGYSNSVNFYPSLPDPLTYFSKQLQGNVTLCNQSPCRIQTDYRAVSLAAVDMTRVIAGDPINNSTYFVPLGFNGNGIPYAATSNGTKIVYPNNPANYDLNSFTFESGYWSSYWAASKNLGSTAISCYPTTATTIAGTTSSSNINQYTLAGDNGVFVVKSGPTGNNGNGSEVLQITGLDLLSSNITTIKGLRGSINSAGESDFSTISGVQIIDPYNTYFFSVSANWLNGSSGTKNAGPLTPYMFSRTLNNNIFGSTTSAVGNISVLNLGGLPKVCTPYWVRDTYGSADRALGMDSAWLTANPVPSAPFLPAVNSTYSDASIDPAQSTIYSYSTGSGAQLCTDVSPVLNTPIVYCANFLTSSISRFNITAGSPVFNPF